MSPEIFALTSIFTCASQLQFVAASNLDVATFQVTYQMKVSAFYFFGSLETMPIADA